MVKRDMHGFNGHLSKIKIKVGTRHYWQSWRTFIIEVTLFNLL